MNGTRKHLSASATTIRVLFDEKERKDFEQFIADKGLKKGAFTKRVIMEEIARERRAQIEALR